MKPAVRVTMAISLAILVMGATVSTTQAAAPKAGTACKTLGQKIVSGKLTYTCAKSGTKLVWSKGYKLPLRVLTKTFPAAISGKAYRVQIEVTGGTGYHSCTLQKGSRLPTGYALNSKTCLITGVGEILPVGTTKRVSPPFSILVTDSASPKPTVIRLTSSIITYPPPPVINVFTATCWVNIPCKALVATATGGSPPYTFRSGSGFPPIGLSVWSGVDGGYAAGIARTVTPGALFQVCVVDLAGRSACKNAGVIVKRPPTYLVKVIMNGDAKGLVWADSGDIFCGGVCQGNYSTDSRVVLDAIPNDGVRFMGWSGDCMGRDKCTLVIDGDKVVTATFSINSTGTYTGTAFWPYQNIPGHTGCEGGSVATTFQIVEGEGGVITGKSGIPFSGKRVGNTMTITADAGGMGLRGPFEWNWDGTRLTGSMPAFCWDHDTGTLVGDSKYTFDLKLVP